MAETPQKTGTIRSSSDEIYVGYLKVPKGIKRFVRVAVPIMLWVMCGVAIVVARSQRDPGPAVWDTGTPRTLSGVLVVKPYPVLVTGDRGDGKAGTLLVVEMGKHGSHARALAFDGKRVSITGWLLNRDGRRMLELEPGDAAISASIAESETAAAGMRAVEVPPIRPLGPVTLRGEIVDSKCFLGAMKPGDGRTHKECATLCVTGGIPPMLVTRDAAGVATYYLLVDAAGGEMGPEIRPMIADPVSVEGELESWGEILRLRVASGGVKRLSELGLVAGGR